MHLFHKSFLKLNFMDIKVMFFFAMVVFQNIHVSFLRTVPPYSHQADVWVELLKHLGYRKVIFIHSSDTDGRALLGRFQSTSQSLEDDVEMKVQVRHTETSYTSFKVSSIVHFFQLYFPC
jgi:ABC-type branched-chain amino acid transport systems, periplasmic component